MGAVVSLDGYMADTEDGVGPLFDWLGNGDVEWKWLESNEYSCLTTQASRDFMKEVYPSIGAVVIGRRVFDLTDGWDGVPAAGDHVFVVTHEAPTDWKYAGTAPFTFVTDGVEAAIAQAREFAGPDREVDVAAGQIGGQALRLGLIDQVVMNVVPVVFGAGRPFFGAMGPGETIMLAEPLPSGPGRSRDSPALRRGGQGSSLNQAPAKPKSPRHIRVAILGIILFAVAAMGLFVWGVAHGNLPSEAEKAEQIERLEATVMPVVEDLQVEYFMDLPDCAGLTYPRGDFIDGDPEHCGGSTDSPADFDDVARADHERIKAALEASETVIERVGGRFSSDGSVIDAWFMSTHGAPFATSWSLEYEPEGTRKAGKAGMVTLTPVEGKADWWFACCAD